MKKLLLLTVLMSGSCSSFADEIVVNENIYLEMIRKAISVSNNEFIKDSLISQTNEAIAISGEAKQFLKVNHANIDLNSFKALYSEIMNSEQLHKFKNALLDHGGKSVLVAASNEYKNKKHGCEVTLDSYGVNSGQEFKKITVKCMPTVYGRDHWIPVTQKIKDVFYVSNVNGEDVLEQVEFGLLNNYSQKIESLLKEANEITNEKYI